MSFEHNPTTYTYSKKKFGKKKVTTLTLLSFGKTHFWKRNLPPFLFFLFLYMVKSFQESIFSFSKTVKITLFLKTFYLFESHFSDFRKESDKTFFVNIFFNVVKTFFKKKTWFLDFLRKRRKGNTF